MCPEKLIWKVYLVEVFIQKKLLYGNIMFILNVVLVTGFRFHKLTFLEKLALLFPRVEIQKWLESWESSELVFDLILKDPEFGFISYDEWFLQNRRSWTRNLVL